MASIKLKGDTSGEVTIQAPSVAGTNTLELQATSGTLATTAQASIGMKNRIINGNMAIDQRNAGASHTITTGSLFYGVDRFFTFCSGANLTGQRITGTNTGTAYAYKITGATGSTSVNYGQRIENVNVLDLNSQTVTVSLKLYASATISNVNITLFYCSGVNTGYGSTSASQPITVVSGLNTYSVNFTLPSAASNGFECAIGFPSGIGNGVSVEITEIQLETGTTATPFEHLQFGQQLALCQRYYYKISGTNISYGAGFTNNSTNIRWHATFPVQMRTAPTALETTGTASNYRILQANSVTCTSVPNFQAASESTFRGGATCSTASFSFNNGAMFDSGGTAFLAWSTEL